MFPYFLEAFRLLTGKHCTMFENLVNTNTHTQHKCGSVFVCLSHCVSSLCFLQVWIRRLCTSSYHLLPPCDVQHGSSLAFQSSKLANRGHPQKQPALEIRDGFPFGPCSSTSLETVEILERIVVGDNTGMLWDDATIRHMNETHGLMNPECYYRNLLFIHEQW